MYKVGKPSIVKPQEYEAVTYNLLRTMDKLNLKATWLIRGDISTQAITSNKLSKYAYRYGYGRK